VSQSTLNVATNLITVNTNTPGVRLGGLAVIDSASSSPVKSGSFLFDSTNDQWIMVHQDAGNGITSSVALMGPQTYNNVGNETLLTKNRVLKSEGLEHVTNSSITDDGSTVIVTAVITASGYIAAGGNLISNNSSGDEGGEILLAKPQTNTTLTGSGVTIDVYQNKLRIFEQGGAARGGYWDITALAGGASTNLVTAGSSGTSRVHQQI